MWVSNLTPMNFISISVAVVVIIACVVAIVAYRRKLKRLDGLHGIIPLDKEHVEQDENIDLGMKDLSDTDTPDDNNLP